MVGVVFVSGIKGYAKEPRKATTENVKNEGTTKITVTCGKVSACFELTVKKAASTEVAVTELDLGECPKEITIGTSQLLSVAVIPANATKTSFTYESSNPTVASVSATVIVNEEGTAAEEKNMEFISESRSSIRFGKKKV